MVEPQLVDYIKKAREAQQTDEQTRALLYKNGWSEAEVREAFSAIIQPQPQIIAQPQPQPQYQPQASPQAQPEPDTKVEIRQQPQQAQQPQYQAQPMASKKKSHWVLKLFIVLFILVALLGGGYYVASQYYGFSIVNYMGGDNPETVLKKMSNNMKAAKTYNMAAKLSAEMSGSEMEGVSSLSMNVEGGVDFSNASNPKEDLTIAFDALNTSGDSSSADISVISVDKALYVKTDNVSLPEEMSKDINLSQITEKWLKIDQDTASYLSSIGYQNVNYQNVFEGAFSASGFEKYLAEDMFTFNSVLADESINGEDSYHYSLKISKDKIESLLNESFASSGGYNNADTQNMAPMIAEVIGDINVETWIGKKDYMLYKYQIDKTINLSDVISFLSGSLKLKIERTNSGFNEPQDITAPSDWVKAEEALEPLLKPYIIKSDMSYLWQISQMIFYEKEGYTSLCSKGWLNGSEEMYGQDLININADIKNQGASHPICFSSAEDFCISTQLSDKTYMCIDKNGNLGTVRCSSYSTVCR